MDLSKSSLNFSSYKTKVIPGHKRGVLTLAWNATGSRLASGSNDCSLRIWNPEKGETRYSTELLGHSSAATSCVWNPSHSERLASTSLDKSILWWDIRAGKSCTNSVILPGQNVFIDWSPCGKYLVTSSKDDHLTLVDASTFKIIQSVKFENELNEPRFTPLSTHIILTTNNGQIRLFTVPDLEPVFAIPSQPGNCYCSDLDPLGETLVVGSTDSIVSFWDVKEWSCKANTGDIRSAVRSLSWSFDSKLVAAGSEERYISIIDGCSFEQVAKVETSGTQNCVRWHPSKYLLAFSCEIPMDHVSAGSVRLWS